MSPTEPAPLPSVPAPARPDPKVDSEFDPNSPVTQFAVLDALLAGDYDSGIPVPRVREFGDFGIGCCDHLGGEVILLDGTLWECTADGLATLMHEDEVLPFVDVCRFVSALRRRVRDADLAAFTAQLEDALVSRNLFHAVRVDGRFDSVRVRVTPRQVAGRPLADVTSEQLETVHDDVEGTFVGFWAPRIYQGVTVAGLHGHFLTADRSTGGHVLDLTAADAVLQLSVHARFDLRLPTDERFLATELTHDRDDVIRTVEGGAH